MKKVLLAVAVMATFSSASAFAAFGAETENGTSGNITIGGTITPLERVWMLSIDELPESLNNASISADNAWTGDAGNFEYSAYSIATPLVKIRTKTGAPGSWTRPAIKIGSSPDLMTTFNAQNTIVAPVLFEDPQDGSFKDTNNTTASLVLETSMAAGTDTWIQAGGSEAWGITQTFASQATEYLAKTFTGATISSVPSGNMTGWLTQITTQLNKADRTTLRGLSGVIGTTSVKLNSTSQSKPSGKWQVKLPVTVTYI